MKKYVQFKPGEYKEIREDCWINFECPSCHNLIWADSQNEPATCIGCGNKYSVSAILFHVIEDEK